MASEVQIVHNTASVQSKNVAKIAATDTAVVSDSKAKTVEATSNTFVLSSGGMYTGNMSGNTPKWLSDAIAQKVTDGTSSLDQVISDLDTYVQGIKDGIAQEIINRQDGDIKTAGLVTTAKIENANALAAAVDSVTTKINDKAAEVLKQTVLASEFDDPNSALTTSAWYLQNVKTYTDATKANSTKTDALISTVDDPVTGVAATAENVKNVYTVVGVDEDGNITAGAGALDKLQVQIDGHTTSIETTDSLTAGYFQLYDQTWIDAHPNEAPKVGMVKIEGTKVFQWFGDGEGWRQTDLNAEEIANANKKTSEGMIRKYVRDNGMVHDALSDGSITIFTGDNTPQNPNPFDLWRTSTSTLELGEFDSLDPAIAYITSDGYIYLYWDGYDWQLATANQVAFIKSTDSITAAASLADGKVRLFTTTPVPPYDVGDLWVKENSNEMYRALVARTNVYDETDWVSVKAVDQEARNKVIVAQSFVDSLLTDVDAIKNQVDKSATAYFENYQPIDADGKPIDDAAKPPYHDWITADTDNSNTAQRDLHVGDSFAYYTLDSNNNKVYDSSYKFVKTAAGDDTDADGYTWVAITNDIAAQALATALNAKDIATDHKRRMFLNSGYNGDIPDVPYDIGDMWVRSSTDDNSNDGLYRAQTAKAAGATADVNDWETATAYATKKAIDDSIIAKADAAEANAKAYADDSLGYRVEIESSNGTLFRNGVIQTQLTAKLYRGNVLQTVGDASVTWTKVLNDGIADSDWNGTHSGIGAVINLTAADIDGKATFSAEITI